MGLRKYSTLFILTGVITVADQVIKLIIQAYLLPNHGVAVISGFFNLVNVQNPGGAFGLLARFNPAAARPFFLIVTAVFVAAIIFYYGRIPVRRRFFRFGMTFILGGAVGNLMDRLRQSYVVDFLDFNVGGYHWPAFNLADISITTGAIMFLISTVLTNSE
jgi:signal peptidase II